MGGIITKKRFLNTYIWKHQSCRPPPEGLDETWNHGVFLNGAVVNEFLDLARSYRRSADALLESALESREPREWCYPVLYAYRHALELHLKIIGEIEKPTHNLNDCLQKVEQRHNQKIPSQIRNWILELAKIDPQGTAFRYADDEAGTLKYAEY